MNKEVTKEYFLGKIERGASLVELSWELGLDMATLKEWRIERGLIYEPDLVWSIFQGLVKSNGNEIDFDRKSVSDNLFETARRCYLSYTMTRNILLEKKTYEEIKSKVIMNYHKSSDIIETAEKARITVAFAEKILRKEKILEE